MIRILMITVILLISTSCGKKKSASSSSGASSTTKNLFSKWTHKSTGFYLDFRGGSFYSNYTLYTYLPITQFWIDALDQAGRDTTGLVAGTYFLCELDIYFVGNQSAGSFATNHDDIDTPNHNACLEWDSNCQIGICNFGDDHTYTKTSNKLTVDYFSSSDYGIYGVDTLE